MATSPAGELARVILEELLRSGQTGAEIGTRCFVPGENRYAFAVIIAGRTVMLPPIRLRAPLIGALEALAGKPLANPLATAETWVAVQRRAGGPVAIALVSRPG